MENGYRWLDLTIFYLLRQSPAARVLILNNQFPITQHLHIVTKADIIDRIATGTGLTKIETEAVVNGFITTITDALTEGESVELRGFGSFRIQYRAARTARNPRTQEEIDIPARHVPVFRPAKDFRESVDEAAQAREPS